MLGARLFLLQRLSALVMAPLVITHLAVIVYSVQGGLDAAEILGRTRGSLLWGGIYGLFVVAVSVDGAIGLRVVAFEWLGLRGRGLDTLTWLTGVVMFLLGTRAVVAVVAA